VTPADAEGLALLARAARPDGWAASHGLPSVEHLERALVALGLVELVDGPAGRIVRATPAGRKKVEAVVALVLDGLGRALAATREAL
jgi:hypothetical protein